MEKDNRIPLMTIASAETKSCPYKFGVEGSFYCWPSNCMAWTIVQHETSRENHSGGKEAIFKLARNYNVEPVLKGPDNSTGEWIIPSLGYCKRLWPTAIAITSSEYL